MNEWIFPQNYGIENWKNSWRIPKANGKLVYVIVSILMNEDF